MLAYNFKKSNFQKSDHVREILAKIDAKKSKTGLSIYNQDNSTDSSSPGDSPNNEVKSFFPNLKTARKKAQKRMTTDPSSQHQASRTTRNLPPHRIPCNSKTVNLPPMTFTRGTAKPDERTQQTIPEQQQFDKDTIDVNLNPFGYNRKTLAFQTHKINYVVEWPETWPFKITSFQGKKKTSKGIKRPSPLKTTNVQPSDTVSIEDEEPMPWNAPTKARVLAPVDHPSKQHTMSYKPYVESSILKRALRKPLPKDTSKRFALKSRDKDLEFRHEGDQSRNEKNKDGQLGGTAHAQQAMAAQCLSRDRSPIMPEISKERVDSVPPSTPVPGDQEHKGIPEQQSKLNKETDPSEDDHANHDDDEHSDLKQEASSLLDDIVNQILSESKPLAI